MLDHLWGPTVSIFLHIWIALLLLRFVTGFGERRIVDITVRVIEPETARLDELQLDREEPPEMAVDLQLTPVDLLPPPDAPVVATPASAPHRDLAALDIQTDVMGPLIMKGLFAGRTEAGRAAMLRQYAGRHGAAADAAVRRALDWLKEQQLPDGSWQGSGTASAKTGMTGLALLCFLAYGQTTNSERYGATVERASRFLIETALQPDGRFRYGETAANRGGVYSHGIASYALAEAYAMTRIPQVKSAMERAISYMVQGQREDGGFDYGFARFGGERDRCTSVAAWMAQAMKAAFIAGADVPNLVQAMERAARGFKLNFDSASRHFIYASKTGVPRHSMTPPAVLALQLLGHQHAPEVIAGLESFSDWSPSWTSPSTAGGIIEPLYVWYYVTQALFHAGGRNWQRWNDQFAQILIQHQNPDGSWTWTHGRAADYGPVYATTLSVLSLTVYYRYLPTYQPIALEPLATETFADDILVEVL